LIDAVLLPAYRRGVEGIESKRRQLGDLAVAAATKGDPKRGQMLWQQGKGTCLACHQIGSIGRAIGPDLSRIGAIRSERDLLESILFPSSTLARDYEAHVFEVRGEAPITGVVRSHSAEGLVVVDLAGVEHNLRHDRIVSQQQLEQSLMPMGLDLTLKREELLDLVAYLRSLR
jgi:putative heme-binding domain-containing protein